MLTSRPYLHGSVIITTDYCEMNFSESESEFLI